MGGHSAPVLFLKDDLATVRGEEKKDDHRMINRRAICAVFRFSGRNRVSPRVRILTDLEVAERSTLLRNLWESARMEIPYYRSAR